jgi:hypothetical protein
MKRKKRLSFLEKLDEELNKTTSSDGRAMGDNSNICPKIVVKNYALGWSCITG